MLSFCFGIKTTTDFVYASEDDLESFANAFIDIIKDDNTYKDGDISLDINEDLFVQNDTYMIDSNTFENIVGYTSRHLLRIDEFFKQFN